MKTQTHRERGEYTEWKVQGPEQKLVKKWKGKDSERNRARG